MAGFVALFGYQPFDILSLAEVNTFQQRRATAYFRNAADALLFTEWLERCGIRNLPVVSACCDICRDDLLFELELDAIAKA